jgi:PAS domain S-box-containing protein
MSPVFLKEWINNKLFENVPCNVAIIDRNFNIVENNRNFLEYFGDGKGKKCYSVYHKREKPCKQCPSLMTFTDGESRVVEGEGQDKDGQISNYIVHILPIFDEKCEIRYVVEMSTDITSAKRLQNEYQVLFEKVPCYVTVLNRDFRVVKGNELFRKTFGDITGDHCFEMFKKKSDVCDDCPAKRTFEDGNLHISKHQGCNLKGEKTAYVVTTSPLIIGKAKTQYIIEMAIDVTESENLTDELERADTYRKMFIQNTSDSVIAIDESDKVILFNPSAERLLKYKSDEILGKPIPDGIYHPHFHKEDKLGIREDTIVSDKNGTEVPVRYTAVILKNENRIIGKAIFLRNLTAIKKLEKEKIDAERLAAVGQTVAGLAHGIKNILTGLEGGMYVVSSGLKKSESKKVQQGWEMMDRNIKRITSLVKDLLSFSKGKVPKVKKIDPNILVEKVIELFKNSAEKANITISSNINNNTKPANLEPEDMSLVLENLVSNAIDACQMTEKSSSQIAITCYDEDDNLVFEVKDEGCGMEYDIKQKVFTNFFTTKGSGGTGIGLLLTRKITQEHGGRVEFHSLPGEGTTFKLIFPRSRLPIISENKINGTKPIQGDHDEQTR